jgi:hypothetical protein
VKITIKRDTADLGQEAMVVEVQGAASVVERELAHALKLIDDRLWQQNARLLESREMQDKLAKLSPEAYMLFRSAMRVLMGQEPVDVSKHIQKHRPPDPVGPGVEVVHPGASGDPSAVDELLAGLAQAEDPDTGG